MSMTSTKALLGAIGLLLSSLAQGAPTLVTDVQVFDGVKMHAPRSVLFDENGIIDADYRGMAPVGARVVAGKGRTLLPGLIDSHTHTFVPSAEPLLFGVTTHIDMFTAVPTMQAIRKAMAAKANSGKVDLISGGTLATAPGGHGTQFGVPVPALTGPGQAQAWVDARLAEGSAFIKIVMEEGGHGIRPFNSLSMETVKAVIDAAHQRGKLAVVHVSTARDARRALQAGADGLVHLFLGPASDAGDIEELVRLAKSRKAFVIPTFAVLESMAGVRDDPLHEDAHLAPLLDVQGAASLKTLYGSKAQPQLLVSPKALTAALQRAGVPVLAGTDAVNPGTWYGISMHRELAALVEAGLTPGQALAAATSAPAKAFGLAGRGCIARACKADLLLVDGDPGKDIRATRQIVEVWKDGRSVQAARMERVAQVRKAASEKKAVLLPADGRISLWQPGKLASPFGAGWMPSTDQMAGGKSTVALDVLPALDDGQHPLSVKARVAPGLPFAWAAVAFMPGAQPMAGADLSVAKSLRFKVRGDGKSYQAMFMEQGNMMPRSVRFTAEPQWREVVLPLASFGQLDLANVTMIGFSAGPAAGDYAFELVDVRLTQD